jgi:hypothetical protein
VLQEVTRHCVHGLQATFAEATHAMPDVLDKKSLLNRSHDMEMSKSNHCVERLTSSMPRHGRAEADLTLNGCASQFIFYAAPHNATDGML